MLKFLTDDYKEKYESFIQQNKKGHFMQSLLWARLKSEWKNEVVLSVDESNNILGSMSVLIRKIPIFKYTIMYCPRGPVCDIYNERVFGELVEGVKTLAKKYNAFVFKIDPDVKKDDEKFCEIVKKFGFKMQNTSKNFEGIQPRFVFRLNIKDKTEDEIMEDFHSKTRYNIKVAIKKGVTAKIGTIDDIGAFHKIMEETGQRDKFVIRSKGYFEKMHKLLSPNFLRLYIMEFENKVVAGSICIYFGNKVWYLYGASSNAYRNVMPNYLMQWEMIKWAIEKKCEIYDFRGVSGDLDENNPLYGLYRFKKGFNGEFTEFIGELDLVFKPFVKHMVENGEKIFRELRRKIYLLKGKKEVTENEGSNN